MGLFNRDSDRVEIDTDRRKILERPWIQLPSEPVPSEKPEPQPAPEPPRRTWRRREPTPEPTPVPTPQREPTPNDDYQEMLLTEEACGGVCTPFCVTLTGSQPRRRGGVSNGGQNYDPDAWRESSLIVRMVQVLTDLLFGEAK